MKKYFILPLLLLSNLAIHPALAGDPPSVEAAASKPATSFSWTGMHAGLNLGYGWSNQTAIYGYETRLPPLRPAGPTGASWANESPLARGVFGGAQVGYDYQISGAGAVLGLQADFQGAGLSGNVDGAGRFNTRRSYYPIFSMQQTLDWFGTVRGRVGYTPLSQLLIYGTGGFAYGGGTGAFSVLYSDFKDFAGKSVNNTNTGWTAGGGVEWALWNNWTMKAEYLYLNLGSTPSFFEQQHCTCSVKPDYFSATQTGSSNRFHTLRLGLNYHFNLDTLTSSIKN